MIERIRVDTGSKTPQATGGTQWTTTATETRWCDAVALSTKDIERYDSLDGKVDYEFHFRGWPTVSMGGSRFVWDTDGHPNKGKVYEPVKPPTKVQGQRRAMIVLVRDTGETNNEVYADVAMQSTSALEAVANGD
jgi:hypothetical protein